jgi:hypothetical protein
MPLRRRVALASVSSVKRDEILHELSLYDIECEIVAPNVVESDASLRAVLTARGGTFWHKAVFRETMVAFKAPPGGIEGFRAAAAGALDADDYAGFVRLQVSGFTGTPLEVSALEDGEAVVLFSRLDVFMMEASEQARVREGKYFAQAGALHTTAGGSAGAPERPETAPTNPGAAEWAPLKHHVYTHAAEGYVDMAQRVQPAGAGSVAAAGDGGVGAPFGWDDVVVPLGTMLTYEALRQKGLKLSPRSMNVATFVMEHIHYKKRMATNFIHKKESSSGSQVQTVPPLCDRHVSFR